jgi:predicted RNA-binding Zn-ribbon protein involved in translation (DUF1610 family)
MQTVQMQFSSEGAPRRKSLFASVKRVISDLNEKAQTEWNSVQAECPSCAKIVTVGSEQAKAKFFSCPGCSQIIKRPSASSKFTYHTSKIADGLNRGVNRAMGKEAQIKLLAVTVPPNTPPGAAFIVAAPNGEQYQVVVPPGFEPGQQFNINATRIQKVYAAQTIAAAVATGATVAAVTSTNVPVAVATAAPLESLPVAAAVAPNEAISQESSRLNSRAVSTAVGAAFSGSASDGDGRQNSRTVANAVVSAFKGNISRSEAPPIAPAAPDIATAAVVPITNARPIAGLPVASTTPTRTAVDISEMSEEEQIQIALAESQAQQAQQTQALPPAAKRDGMETI